MPLKDGLTRTEIELLDRMEAELFPPVPPECRPPLLFHYTTAEGFHSIIKTKELWATHFRYLNDSTELTHGETLLLEETRRALETARTPAHRMLLEQIIHLSERYRLSADAGIYVASFSEHEDQLSQWRAYGGNGSGYAVGFRGLPSPIDDKPDANAGLSLFKCTYDAGAFAGRCRSILEEAGQIFEAHGTRQTMRLPFAHALLGTATTTIARRLATEVLQLKHSAFSEENEWRLVVLTIGDHEKDLVRFRSARNSIKPYIPISLGMSTDGERVGLGRVVVGPGENSVQAELAARMLLAQMGYPGNDLVAPSRVPYRSVA